MKIENEFDQRIILLAMCSVLLYNDSIESKRFVSFLENNWDQLSEEIQKECKFEILNLFFNIDGDNNIKKLNFTNQDKEIWQPIIDKKITPKLNNFLELNTDVLVI